MSEPQTPIDPQDPSTEGTEHVRDASQAAEVRYAPPVHPYAQPAKPPAGRGLAIAAMALGLVALITVIVSSLYFRAGAALGVVVAIVAIVLGIIALVKRQRPVPAIVGLGSAAISIIGALVVAVFAVGAAITAAAGAGAAGQGGSSESAPVDPSTPVVEWPANYASGGLILTKDGPGIGVVPSDALADNALPTPEVSGNAPSRIHVYLDYRCPYCAMFEEANGATIEAAITSGAADVELTPLTFLDKASAGSQYSSRAAGALACIADSQPDAAWDAHSKLLSTAFQPAEGIAGPSNDELIAALDDATGGLDSATQSCIEDEAFVPFAQALNDWVFANPVPDANDDTVTVTGTPFVIVNGEPYPGDPADADAFRAFLEEQGVSLG